MSLSLTLRRPQGYKRLLGQKSNWLQRQTRESVALPRTPHEISTQTDSEGMRCHHR